MKTPFYAALLTLVLARAVAQEGAPLTADPEAAPVARIVTQVQKPAECIAAVHIQKIDGERVSVPAGGFELAPGPHSINGVATLDTTYCRPVSGRNSRAIPDLRADFEADKTYYVGLDYSDRNSEAWRLVIWRTEPEGSEAGGLR